MPFSDPSNVDCTQIQVIANFDDGTNTESFHSLGNIAFHHIGTLPQYIKEQSIFQFEDERLCLNPVPKPLKSKGSKFLVETTHKDVSQWRRYLIYLDNSYSTEEPQEMAPQTAWEKGHPLRNPFRFLAALFVLDVIANIHQDEDMMAHMTTLDVQLLSKLIFWTAMLWLGRIQLLGSLYTDSCSYLHAHAPGLTIPFLLNLHIGGWHSLPLGHVCRELFDRSIDAAIFVKADGSLSNLCQDVIEISEAKFRRFQAPVILFVMVYMLVILHQLHKRVQKIHPFISYSCFLLKNARL